MIINKHIKAFTLLETIVVVALVGFLAASALIPVSIFFSSNQMQTKTSNVVEMLRKAHSYSLMRIKDSRWGVKFDSVGNKAVFFKGESFAGRDSLYDEEISFPAAVSFSRISLNAGGDEVGFSKNGNTTAFGEIDIVGDTGTNTIKINQLGLIDVN